MTDRGRRRLIAAGAVLVVLLAALVLLPQVLLPRDRLADELATRIEAATGGELEPGGLGVRIFGGPALVLQDGRFTWRGDDGTEVTVEYARLEASLAMGELLAGRTVLGDVHLAGPLFAALGPGLALRCEEYGLWLEGLDLESATAGEDVACDFRLRVGEVHQGGTVWHELRWDGRWQDRRTTGARASVRIGTGRVEGSLDLDYAGDPQGRLDGKLNLAAVPAALLLPPILPDLARRLDTDLDGEVAGGLVLGDAAVRDATLALQGELQGGEGQLRAEDWLREVEPYLGERRDLVTVQFIRLDHRFVVRDGRYSSDRLELDGDDTDWQARGWIGFAGDLDVALRVKLPQGFTPDLGAMSFLAETLRGDDGRIDLGLNLSGRSAAPRLGLDLSRRP